MYQFGQYQYPVMQAANPLGNKLELLRRAKELAGGNNPVMAAVRAMTNGRDPQKVFYDECARRGVNPDDILSLLK